MPGKGLSTDKLLLSRRAGTVLWKLVAALNFLLASPASVSRNESAIAAQARAAASFSRFWAVQATLHSPAT